MCFKISNSLSSEIQNSMPLVLLRSRLQERLQDFIINFLKNIFTSVLAPQTAIASLSGPGMIRKENNCNKIKVKKNN